MAGVFTALKGASYSSMAEKQFSVAPSGSRVPSVGHPGILTPLVLVLPGRDWWSQRSGFQTFSVLL